MAELDLFNTTEKPSNEKSSLASVSIREAFQEWLYECNESRYSPEVLLDCIDRISKYAVRKKISEGSLWEYASQEAFKPVFNKLIEAKLLRVTYWYTYTMFTVAGRLYLRFLNEKPFESQSAIESVIQQKRVGSATPSVSKSQDAIDPEVVITWLVTQPNTNGTIYLENVVRQYIWALRSAPAKLEIPSEFEVINVFSCHTPEELNSCWDILKSAPNYKQVNNSTSGMFSAGMGCLLRYLQYLSEAEPKVQQTEELNVIEVLKDLELTYVDKRSSGEALWVIGGLELTDSMKKLRNMGFHFHFKEGGGIRSKHRDAWWYKQSNRADQSRDEEPQVTQPTSVKATAWVEKAHQVDFSRPELCAQTRPLDCTIKGKRVFPNKQNWAQLLVAITEHFIAEDNPNLPYLEVNPIYGNKPFFMPFHLVPEWCASTLLSNGKWISTNYNPQTITIIIKDLCLHCGLDLNDVVITFVPKSNKPKRLVSPYPIDPEIKEKITGVLSRHFANGYRLGSPIEMTRFRSFALEDLNSEISMSDLELEDYIQTCGTVFDGKVYVVSEEAKERIKAEAEKYFSTGAQVIFFAEFYVKNERWLFDASVVFEDMLTDILRSMFPKLFFTRTYFGFKNDSVYDILEGEILRVWGDDVLLTYEKLAERLQYIPIDRIKSALSQNRDFIWSSTGTFSHVGRIDITENERESICKAAEQGCNDHGYVSITDLPFGEIGERNYQLSITAVQNSVFRICLSDKFVKKGKIITFKGYSLDILTIMKDFCRSAEKCSFDDLLDYGKELTGGIHHWIAIEAGNSVMIRVDKDTFVSDRNVRFDPEAVDAAIEMFFKGNYLPLKSFTTFSAFPDCGQVWNLFLLESYCRRFSKKFCFDTLSLNSRNSGAVIRKSCGLNYTEIMADAVVDAKIPLEASSVGRFLVKAGYVCRSTKTKLNEIIDKSKNMQERRD